MSRAAGFPLNPTSQQTGPLRLARRVAQIEPFWVMECAKAADEIARSPRL